jgi:hypothetical protein
VDATSASSAHGAFHKARGQILLSNITALSSQFALRGFALLAGSVSLYQLTQLHSARAHVQNQPCHRGQMRLSLFNLNSAKAMRIPQPSDCEITLCMRSSTDYASSPVAFIHSAFRYGHSGQSLAVTRVLLGRPHRCCAHSRTAHRHKRSVDSQATSCIWRPELMWAPLLPSQPASIASRHCLHPPLATCRSRRCSTVMSLCGLRATAGTAESRSIVCNDGGGGVCGGDMHASCSAAWSKDALFAGDSVLSGLLLAVCTSLCRCEPAPAPELVGVTAGAAAAVLLGGPSQLSTRSTCMCHNDSS